MKGTFSQQIINQRYLQSLQKRLKMLNFEFKQSQSGHQSKNVTNEQLQQHIIGIKQSEQVISQKNKFYFKLLKRFYSLRKIINPEMTFQTFLQVYNQELNSKLQKFKINDLIKDMKSFKSQLNGLILKKELAILSQQIVQLIENRSSEIIKLQQQSQKVNQEYNSMIQNLIQEPTLLNLQSIQLQVKLKMKEKQTKNDLTQTFLSNKQKNSVKTTNQASLSKKIPDKKLVSSKNDRKEEVERIKTVIKNNMWGYGDQIQQRLQKLKILKEQTQK